MLIKLNLTGIPALIAIFLIAIGSIEILDKISEYFNINKNILIYILIIILIFVKLYIKK